MKCAILTCPMDGSNKCCRDCEFFKTCAVRCENDPQKCGQIIQREEKRTETSGQNLVQSRQTFYTAESDDGFCRNYIKRRRI